ncbi:PHD finger protein EHD3 [Cynara cardunculus var. scolymus]|uniref:Zinc finger, FYVE/PHD-type n=1 Tax=Cynara cardunculus var. scolymus TaxID=59895 RepID=A0A118I9D5_CYNCS|nr:PHD finger protein EHD3 [Cynara cardunculus var. scolymus]KVG94851.1 Zinc finger, FYVE/PHD-type [Cynara cardunculus var. scolymus]
MVDERETTNGHGCDLNCSMGPTTGATNKGGLLLDGNSGGFSFGEGTSAEGLRIYKRRKRRKMSNSDEMTKSIFNDKIKDADGVASDQDALRLSFDAFPIGAGECSLRHCRKIVLQQMYQSLGGCEDGLGHCILNALVSYPESGTSAVKEPLDGVEKSDNQTHNCATELSHFMSSGLLNQSESSTISGLCGRAFFDILMSDKFSELCALLLKNFDGVNVNGILDVNAINMRMKTGAYESLPMLYLKDVQQVWTKLQQVGNEMVMLAKGLSDKSRDDYEQLVRKAKASEACNCQGCGEKADVGNCLVCDSCEEIYHVSCSEIVGTEIPPRSWYCAKCVSNGIGSPHDNCVVCEKLKAIPTNADQVEEDVPNGFEADMHDEITDGSSKICFICKSEVKKGDNFRTCGHLLCGHKFYHHRCLTSKQLGVYGPSWFCPSCLCRGCLVDKDDENIVLCDGCDQAYHTYCMSPQLHSIPKGSWFCDKCDRELKQIRRMKLAYENMQNKVKVEEGGGTGLEKKSEYEDVAVMDEDDDEERDKSGGGLEMLVTAAKTLSHQESEYGYHS